MFSINMIITISCVFIGFWLYSGHDSRIDVNKQLSKKADKIELENFKADVNERFKRESLVNQQFLEQLDKSFEKQTKSLKELFDTKTENLKQQIEDLKPYLSDKK